VADITELAAELVDVQHQLAFQEDTITALNDALALQQKEILILRRQVELLKQRQDGSASPALIRVLFLPVMKSHPITDCRGSK